VPRADAVAARRLLGHSDIEDDFVRCASLLDIDVDLREEAECLDIRLALRHEGAAEGVAFSKAELAPDDEVARLGVAGDIDALDIEVLPFVDEIGHPDHA